MPPLPFFISLEKSLLKVIWARGDSPAFGVGGAGRGIVWSADVNELLG